MKRAIGAIAVYEDPTDGQVAFLQVRKSDDSFPACVEKTWGGGAEEGEPLAGAICREFREEVLELCHRAGTRVLPLSNLHKLKTSADPELSEGGVVDEVSQQYVLERLNVLRVEGKKLVVTLLCRILDLDLVTQLKPLIQAGLLMRITRADMSRLVPINPADHKKTGLSETDRAEGKLGMFLDEIVALKKALGIES